MLDGPDGTVDSGLGNQTNEFATSSQKILEDLEAKQEAAQNLVGAIGVTGTAERYKDEADLQKGAANNWRWIAVVSGAIAVVVAGSAAHAAGASDLLPFLGRLSVGVAIGGVATYAAKQSGRHRNREEDAKAIQLDLAAFDAFIEPLPDEKQDEERIALGRRIFGQRFRAVSPDGTETGPTVVGQAIAQATGNRNSEV